MGGAQQAQREIAVRHERFVLALRTFAPGLPDETQQHGYPGAQKRALLRAQGGQVRPAHPAMLQFVSHVLAIQLTQLGAHEHGAHVPQHDAAHGLVHAAEPDAQQAVLRLGRATKRDWALPAWHELSPGVAEAHRPIPTPLCVLILVLHGALGELNHGGSSLLDVQIREYVLEAVPGRELALGPLPPVIGDQRPLCLPQLFHMQLNGAGAIGRRQAKKTLLGSGMPSLNWDRMSLAARAFAGLVFLLGVLAVALFVGAGTFAYWQAWVFLSVFTTAVASITIDLARRDPALLARRVQAGPIAETTRAQKRIQSLASLAFLGTFVVSALDQRAGGARPPAVFVVFGDGLVAFGLWLVFRVFRANTFTSATIEVASGQHVVSTGPYATVRHPMYSGALLFLLGVPLALGSYWGLLGLPPLAAVIIWRLLDEERYLSRNLAGYEAYRGRVRYRLAPRIW